MKNHVTFKVIILCLSLTTMISGFTSCAKEVSAQTLSGYLIDSHCFVKKPDSSLDSKTCLMMPTCAATGYGIAVPQSDKSYKFYYFDGEYAPKATDTQVLAANIASSTTKKDHLYVTVSGTLTGKEKKDAYGTSYPVMKVTSISESAE